MPDREKVIKEAEEELEYLAPDDKHRLHMGIMMKLGWIYDVLTLLKEQEAAEPIYIENPYTHLPVSYCPKCREPIDQYITGNQYRKTKYCHYCGQAVKWNE